MKNQALTMCKCNAGGRSIPAFSPCSATANPSWTDVGLKNMFNKKAGLAQWQIWLDTVSESRTPLAPTVVRHTKRQATFENSN